MSFGNLFKCLDKNCNGINANKIVLFFLFLLLFIIITIIYILILHCWRIVALFTQCPRNFKAFIL